MVSNGRLATEQVGKMAKLILQLYLVAVATSPTPRSTHLRFETPSASLNSFVAQAATLSQVVEGHEHLLLNPREAAVLFLAVIAFCAVLTMALSKLEASKSVLLQSFFVASTRVIIVIGANSVLLSFVSGLFEAGRITEDVLLVLNWVYFVFFFFMVGLVFFSLFGVVVISVIVRRQAAAELRLIEEGKEAVINNDSVAINNLSFGGINNSTFRGRNRSGTLLENVSMVLGKEAHADLLRKLRIVYLQSILVAFPHKVKVIANAKLGDYVTALQQWDASTLTDLSTHDWVGIFASVLVNAIRVRIVILSGLETNSRQDFYSFFAVLGVAPALVFISSCVSLFTGLHRFAAASFENTAKLRAKRSSKVKATTPDGIDLFFTPHLITVADMDAPSQFIPGQRFHLFAAIAKVLLLQQLFYLILFILEFAITTGPFWMVFSLVPPLLVFSMLPLMTLTISLMTGLGADLQHSVAYSCLLRQEEAEKEALKQRSDEIIKKTTENGGHAPRPGDSRSPAGPNMNLLSSRSATNATINMVESSKNENPLNDVEEDERRRHESPTDRQRRKEEEMEAEFDEVVNSSIAALEYGRHRSEQLKPKAHPLDPARQNQGDLFHLYCALERCRTDYEAHDAKRQDLENQLREELQLTATVSKHLGTLKDILTDRVSLSSVPLENTDWHRLSAAVEQQTAARNPVSIADSLAHSSKPATNDGDPTFLSRVSAASRNSADL